jgi:hypothetical protein
MICRVIVLFIDIAQLSSDINDELLQLVCMGVKVVNILEPLGGIPEDG